MPSPLALSIGLNVVLALAGIGAWLAYRRKKRRYAQVTGQFDAPLPRVHPGDFDPALRENEIGTTLDSEVSIVGSGFGVSASTSDTEAWILSVLARRSERIFEFGTASGRTAYLLARNSPPTARVTTITLPASELDHYAKTAGDNTKATNIALKESQFQRFLYTGSAVESKITQLFGDSKAFDETPHAGQYDLIFVDGSHAFSYVKSDTEKALRMVKPGGAILWHDYRGAYADTRDVYTCLNEYGARLKLVRLGPTSLVAYRHPR
jgi:predicted O-methyltransferase YrrM